MARAFLFILDSFGIGGAPDAAQYGDMGSNTLGNIAQACFSGEADQLGLRSGKLSLPNMEALGLGLAAQSACGALPSGFSTAPELQGCWANAQETSKGKDSPSGHWEIAGLPVLEDWGYFTKKTDSFPKDLLANIIENFDIDGTLCNKHTSGTDALNEFGEEHLKSGRPIFYTSVDSVLQIAAHEEQFGLQRLYDLCELTFKFTKELNIGRVIARPFEGKSVSEFKRTANRRDFSIKPPESTLLDIAKADNREVVAIGKIADIYAHSGPSKTVKASGNVNIARATLDEMPLLADGGLMLSNFVDFDTEYGHRRDVVGYANALEQFDLWIPTFIEQLRDDDLLIFTADHGCDPTWRGTDHTREQVPVLCVGPKMAPGSVGTRTSFADIGATLGEHIRVGRLQAGKSFLKGLTS